MEISLLHTGKYEGGWWLPGKQENAIQGTLEIMEDGEMYFQTLHNFNQSSLLFGENGYNELHGLVKSESDNHDYHVLVFDLIQVHRTSGKLSRTRFFVHKALIGESKFAISSNYNKLMVSSKVFSRWVEGTGIKIEEREIPRIVTYKQPEPIDLFSNKDITGYIFFRCNHAYGPSRTVKIVEQPFLNLELSESENLKGILQQLVCTERFLMVLWEQYHVFTDINLENELKGRFKLLASKHMSKSLEVSHFNFSAFRNSGAKYYFNWLKIYEQFNLAIRTFFFAFADYKVDIHSRFLNYVFALEQLHRKGFRATEPLSKKDKAMYEKAMQIKQGDLKSWLEKVLNKERDIRLTTRLKELHEFAEIKDPEKISNEEITRIKNMRSYLVHLDEKHKKTSFTSREVYEINQKMERLFFRVLKKSMVEEKPWPAFS